MFILYADKTKLEVRAREQLTSGSVNIYRACFEFSPDWEGLERTAVFRAGDVSTPVPLDDGGRCYVPPEPLKRAGMWLYAGVCGTREGKVVLPTVWVGLGFIEAGVPPIGGEKPIDHRALSHRDAEDQHPIEAIAGLKDALEQIPSIMTAEQLRKILMN